MEKIKSEIGFNYETIKITKSRIDKGLLAIPVSLLDFFPKEKTDIFILFDNEDIPSKKHFTPYSSSSRECRIGGLSNWFIKNNFQDKDEIVVQILDKEEKIYRLIKENQFITTINQIQNNLENLENEEEVITELENLSKKVNVDKRELIVNEFLKLENKPTEIRKIHILNVSQKKESVPTYLKTILYEIYNGKCQLTGFTFLQKNGRYFSEIHHINPEQGNHIKNLLIVSANIHRQFTYSNFEQSFDENGWLRKVNFVDDSREYNVNQMIDKFNKKEFIKNIHI